MTGRATATLRRRWLLTLVVFPGLWAAFAGLMHAGVAWLGLAPSVAGMAVYCAGAAAIFGIAEVWAPVPRAGESLPTATLRRRWLLTLVVFPGLWLALAGLMYAGVAWLGLAPAVASVVLYLAVSVAVFGIAIVWDPRKDAGP